MFLSSDQKADKLCYALFGKRAEGLFGSKQIKSSKSGKIGFYIVVYSLI